MIILETNMGEIHITVDAEKAPITAKTSSIMWKKGSLMVLFFIE